MIRDPNSDQTDELQKVLPTMTPSWVFGVLAVLAVGVLVAIHYSSFVPENLKPYLDLRFAPGLVLIVAAFPTLFFDFVSLQRLNGKSSRLTENGAASFAWTKTGERLVISEMPHLQPIMEANAKAIQLKNHYLAQTNLRWVVCYILAAAVTACSLLFSVAALKSQTSISSLVVPVAVTSGLAFLTVILAALCHVTNNMVWSSWERAVAKLLKVNPRYSYVDSGEVVQPIEEPKEVKPVPKPKQETPFPSAQVEPVDDGGWSTGTSNSPYIVDETKSGSSNKATGQSAGSSDADSWGQAGGGYDV